MLIGTLVTKLGLDDSEYNAKMKGAEAKAASTTKAIATTAASTKVVMPPVVVPVPKMPKIPLIVSSIAPSSLEKSVRAMREALDKIPPPKNWNEYLAVPAPIVDKVAVAAAKRAEQMRNLAHSAANMRLDNLTPATRVFTSNLQNIGTAWSGVVGAFRQGASGIGQALMTPVRAVQSLTGWLFNMKNAIMAAGAAWVMSKAINPAMDEEKQSAKMTAIFGGNKKVGAAMWGEAEKRGSYGIFSEQEYVGAIRNLKNLGGGALLSREYLGLFEDQAVKTGQSVGMVSRSYGMMYDMLSKDAGAKISPWLARMQRMGAVTADTVMEVRKLEKAGAGGEAIWKVVQASLEKSKGAMKDMTQTTSAQLAYTKYIVGEAFESFGLPILAPIKRILKTIQTLFLNLQQDGTLERWGKNVAATLDRVWSKIVNGIKWVRDNWELVKTVLVDAAIIVGIVTIGNVVMALVKNFQAVTAAVKVLGIAINTLSGSTALTTLLSRLGLIAGAAGGGWMLGEMLRKGTKIGAAVEGGMVDMMGGQRQVNPRNKVEERRAMWEDQWNREQKLGKGALQESAKWFIPEEDRMAKLAKMTSAEAWALFGKNQVANQVESRKIPAIDKALGDFFGEIDEEAKKGQNKLKFAGGAGEPAKEFVERQYAGASKKGSVEAYTIETRRYDSVVDFSKRTADASERTANATEEQIDIMSDGFGELETAGDL